MNFPYAFIIASNCTLVQTSLYLLLDSRTLRNGEVTAIQVNLVENKATENFGKLSCDCNIQGDCYIQGCYYKGLTVTSTCSVEIERVT